MTLEQLRIFIEVAECQHVTKASKELNLTQSATSAAVAALEERYNTRLFDRIGRGVVLTQAGHIFLNEARAVVAKASSAKQVLHDLAGLRRGSLTIAASQTVANYWLPGRLHRFWKAFPDIRIHVAIGNTQRVADLVETGSADLGFVEGVVTSPALTVQAFEGDSLAVVVGSSHPWVGRSEITPRNFNESSWVLREKGSGTRSMFEAALRGFNLDPSELAIAFEIPSNEAACSLVAAGETATAVSNLVIDRFLPAGTLHRIKCDLPGRPFFVLRHKERYASHTEAAVRSVFGVCEASAL